MVANISTWGNAMAVWLSNKFITDNKLKENSELEIILEELQNTFRSIKKKRKKMPVKELIKGMTREVVLADFKEWSMIGK